MNRLVKVTVEVTDGDRWDARTLARQESIHPYEAPAAAIGKQVEATVIHLGLQVLQTHGPEPEDILTPAAPMEV